MTDKRWIGRHKKLGRAVMSPDCFGNQVETVGGKRGKIVGCYRLLTAFYIRYLTRLADALTNLLIMLNRPRGRIDENDSGVIARGEFDIETGVFTQSATNNSAAVEPFIFDK